MSTPFAPTKCINSTQDLEAFNKSPVQQEILKFIQACAEAVVDIPNNKEDVHVSTLVRRFVVFMEDLYRLVEATPPIKQPMRFGNKAYRTWHERLPEKIHLFLQDIIPEESREYQVELAAYLADMFGNSTRIDYGTGHELNFALFFICLHKLGLVEEADLTAVISKGFVAYIKTMRKLQLDYMLEPAGSHGVWGLDDYHCLLFFWGSAQLSKHQDIRPSSVHDPEILAEYANDYIYLEGIRFIKQIKVGAPFAETSPMLNDISNIPEWARICSGLLRMFQGEVLNKLPVIQHIVFGRLLPCTWKDASETPPSSSSSSTNADSQQHPSSSHAHIASVATSMPGRGSQQYYHSHHGHPSRHHPNHSQQQSLYPPIATIRPPPTTTSSSTASTMPPTTVFHHPVNISNPTNNSVSTSRIPSFSNDIATNDNSHSTSSGTEVNDEIAK